jgi:hypothetical protein
VIAHAWQELTDVTDFSDGAYYNSSSCQLQTACERAVKKEKTAKTAQKRGTLPEIRDSDRFLNEKPVAVPNFCL